MFLGHLSHLCHLLSLVVHFPLTILHQAMILRWPSRHVGLLFFGVFFFYLFRPRKTFAQINNTSYICVCTLILRNSFISSRDHFNENIFLFTTQNRKVYKGIPDNHNMGLKLEIYFDYFKCLQSSTKVFLMFNQNLTVKSSLPFLVLVPDDSAWKQRRYAVNKINIQFKKFLLVN